VKILDVVIGLGLVYVWESFRTYWVVVVDAAVVVIDVNVDVAAVLNYHIQGEEDRDALAEVVHFDDRDDCCHKVIDDEEVDSNFLVAVESHPVPFLYYFWMLEEDPPVVSLLDVLLLLLLLHQAHQEEVPTYSVDLEEGMHLHN
jgi:hypothetical protein